jgi:hypothetical protein
MTAMASVSAIVIAGEVSNGLGILIKSKDKDRFSEQNRLGLIIL